MQTSTNNYESITRFVNQQIIDAGLTLNNLQVTKSAISSIRRRFDTLGWKSTPNVESTPKTPRYTVLAPNGRESLQMVGGKVFRHPNHTETICRRKHLAKRMLELGGVPVPVGGDFLPEEKEIALAYFGMMPKPAVVKPTDSGGSAGVTIGVNDSNQFLEAWDHALAGGRKKSNVLVEQFVRGVELRAYVVGSEVVSIIARVQPYIVGDGVSTVVDLLEQDRVFRQKNYRTKKLSIVVDWEFVKTWGHSEQTIPKQGDILFLNRLSIPQVGALTVDVSDSVSPSIKDIAMRAKSTIPDLEIAGVDILVNDLTDGETAYVLEINTSAALDLHRYPTHGSPRNVDKDIVEYFHQQHLASGLSAN